MEDNMAVLANENALLDELAGKVAEFTQNPGLGQNERDVLEDWKLYFERWRNINTNLINSSNAAALLAEEKQILIGMRNSITGTSDAATFWRDMLGEDIDNINKVP
jgi:hypothetical protein